MDKDLKLLRNNVKTTVSVITHWIAHLNPLVRQQHPITDSALTEADNDRRYSIHTE